MEDYAVDRSDDRMVYGLQVHWKTTMRVPPDWWPWPIDKLPPASGMLFFLDSPWWRGDDEETLDMPNEIQLFIGLRGVDGVELDLPRIPVHMGQDKDCLSSVTQLTWHFDRDVAIDGFVISLFERGGSSNLEGRLVHQPFFLGKNCSLRTDKGAIKIHDGLPEGWALILTNRFRQEKIHAGLARLERSRSVIATPWDPYDED